MAGVPRRGVSETSQGAPALDVERIIEVLGHHGVEYVLVGGVGARFHGARRMTMDIDLCPAWENDNLARLAAALRELQATLKGLPASVVLPPITAVMLRTMDVGTWRTVAGDIDVLQGIPTDTRWRLNEFEVLRTRAVAADVAGCRVYVAALDDIVTSKQVTGRPADLEALPELEALREAEQNPDPPRTRVAERAPGPQSPTGYPLTPPIPPPEPGVEQ